MDKNRVHVASALTGILGNQKADALAGKSTSKEKTGKDRVVQYMCNGDGCQLVLNPKEEEEVGRKRGCPALRSRPHHHIYSAWTSQSVQPTWATARTSRA